MRGGKTPQKGKIIMFYEEPKRTPDHLWVCNRCLCAIEAHEGKQIHREWDVDPDDERQSKCDWCEETGFCTLNEIL